MDNNNCIVQQALEYSREILHAAQEKDFATANILYQKRTKYIKQINFSDSCVDEDYIQIKELLALNQEIIAVMKSQQGDISKELSQLNFGKKVKNYYQDYNGI